MTSDQRGSYNKRLLVLHRYDCQPVVESNPVEVTLSPQNGQRQGLWSQTSLGKSQLCQSLVNNSNNGCHFLEC